jgi:hypothetical protein
MAMQYFACSPPGSDTLTFSSGVIAHKTFRSMYIFLRRQMSVCCAQWNIFQFFKLGGHPLEKEMKRGKLECPVVQFPAIESKAKF